MKDNVLVRIKTLQDDNDQDPEAIELETPGRFGILNQKYIITYEESDLTGFPDTRTTIKVWPGNVTVTRKGKYNMTLHYETGAHHLCLYPTPYGDIGISIYTSGVDYHFDQTEGRLKVDYTIDADNENFLKNSLNVAVRPMGQRAAGRSAAGKDRMQK